MWEIDWQSGRSIKNWINEMDLMCSQKYQIGLFGAFYFVGIALSGIFLKFSDHYGRKIIIQTGCLVSCFAVFYLYAFEDKYTRYSLLFMLGILSFRLVALYILIMELTPRSYQMYVSAGYAIIDHYLAVILPSIYFRFIGKDYKVIFMIPVIAAPISFLLSLMLPESPQYYYEKRAIDKLKTEFQKISKFNGVNIPSRYEFVFENGSVVDDENRNRRQLWKMIKDKSLTINLFITI